MTKSFARLALEAMGTRTDSLDDRTANEAFRQMVQFLIVDFQKRTRNDADRYNKVEANYVDEAWQNDYNPIDHDCAACKHYQPGNYACQRVTGKISPEGTCDLWLGFEPHDRGDSNEPTRRVLRWNGLKIGVTHEADRDIRFNQPLRGISYGRIYGSYGKAEDGRAIDVWVGPHLKAEDGGDNPNVYWYQQLNPNDGSPDERKLVVGFLDRTGAKIAIQQALPAYLRESMFGGLYPVNPEDLMSYRRDGEEDFLNGNFSQILHTDSCDCGCAECKAKKRKKKINPAPLEDIEDEVQREEVAPGSFVRDANSPERPGFVWVPQSGDRDAYWRRDPRQRRGIEIPNNALGRFVPTRPQVLERGELLYSGLTREEKEQLKNPSAVLDTGDLPFLSFGRQLYNTALLTDELCHSYLPSTMRGTKEETLLLSSRHIFDLLIAKTFYHEELKREFAGNPHAGLRSVRTQDGTIQSFSQVSVRPDSAGRPSLCIDLMAVSPWNLSLPKIWEPILSNPDIDQAQQSLRRSYFEGAYLNRLRRTGTSVASLEAFIRESQNLGLEGRVICYPLPSNRPVFSKAGFQVVETQSEAEGDHLWMELSPERASKFMEMRARTQGRQDSMSLEDARRWQGELNALEEELGGMIVLNYREEDFGAIGSWWETDKPLSFLGDSDRDSSNPERPGFVFVPQSGDRDAYWRRDPRQRRAIELPPGVLGRFVPARPQVLDGGKIMYSGLDRSEQQALAAIAENPYGQHDPRSFGVQLLTATHVSTQLAQHVDRMDPKHAAAISVHLQILDALGSSALEPEMEPEMRGNPLAGLRSIKGRNGVIQGYANTFISESDREPGELGLYVHQMVTAPWNLSDRIWQPALEATTEPRTRQMMEGYLRFRQPNTTISMFEALVRESESLGLKGRLICTPVSTNRPLFSKVGFRYKDGTSYQKGETNGYDDNRTVMELSPDRARQFLEMRSRTQGRKDAMTNEEAWQWLMELSQLEEECGGLMAINPSAIAPSPVRPLEIQPPGFLGDSEEGNEFINFFRSDGERIWVRDETVKGGGYWRFDPRAGKGEDIKPDLKRAFVSQSELSQFSFSRPVKTSHSNEACFVTNGNQEYFYKEDSVAGESTFAAREVLASQVAESANIPNNIVRIIPRSVKADFKRDGYAGTLHSVVPGINFQLLKYAPETREVYDRYHEGGDWVRRALAHPDLAKIYALDTFTGNGDRHDNNLMYDPANDRFHSIDMGVIISDFGRSYNAIRDLRLFAATGGLSDPEQRRNFEIFTQSLKRLHGQNSVESMQARLDFFSRGSYSMKPSEPILARSYVLKGIERLHEASGELIGKLDEIRSKY